MTELLNSIAYSPISKTSGVTLIDAVEVTVLDIAKFPDVLTGEVGVAVLCEDERFHSDNPADYETVTYTGKDTVNSKLTGVTREVEGTAREWPDATVIACMMTAEHIKKINEKVKAHVEAVGTEEELAHFQSGRNVFIEKETAPEGTVEGRLWLDPSDNQYQGTVFQDLENEINNHSTRHEDAGADEISIAGLQGESAELSSHKLDNTPHATAQELKASNQIEVTSTDDATSTTDAPLKTAGGLAVAKSAHVGGTLVGSHGYDLTHTPEPYQLRIAYLGVGDGWVRILETDGDTGGQRGLILLTLITTRGTPSTNNSITRVMCGPDGTYETLSQEGDGEYGYNDVEVRWDGDNNEFLEARSTSGSMGLTAKVEVYNTRSGSPVVKNWGSEMET